MISPSRQYEAQAGRAIPTLTMARLIHSSRRPLADMRGIILELGRAGFSASDVNRYLDEAIARARLMRELAW
jgi:hypothetical protein